jgi:hypothetical protein
LSILDMIQRLNDLDEQDSVDLIEQLELITEMRQKIDRCKFALDQLKLQETYWDDRAKIAAQKKKVMSNSIDRLKNYLASAMLLASSENLEGNEYSVRLTKSQAVETKREVTQRDKIDFYDLVTVSYTWNKKAIGEALKAGDERVSEIAAFKENKGIKFKERMPNGN